MIKPVKFFGVFLLLILIGGLFWFWNLHKPDDINILESEPEFYLDAETLISHYKQGKAHLLEAEKIVEIEGTIKEINSLNNRITVLLEGGADESACVICDMKSDQTQLVQNFGPKDTIRLKGIFKGFLKDAIFLNCIISQSETNE